MSGVFYRSGQPGVQPRARNGQFLPYQPTRAGGAPASAKEPPPSTTTNIVHRDADLPPITPGIGGITDTPYVRSLK